MKLSDKQRLFTKYLGMLIAWAYEHDLELTVGEAFRTAEQQKMYIDHGLSKTKNSKHMERLAIDLNLFIDNQYKTDLDNYRSLGEYWKSLDKDNIWGGDWGWDANHFQYTK